MMKELERKYRNDQLSVEELRLLRERVNAMSDQDIEREMYEVWMDEEPGSGMEFTEERSDRLKQRIDTQIDVSNEKVSRHSYWLLMNRIVRVAAILLLPVFVVLTIYLYQENGRMASEEMVVSTGKGERANITLPDGTVVALNSESSLTYTPKVFNTDKRQIRFEGEGYFQVAKNRDCPFLIDAEGLSVEVLGTTFNLDVRRSDKTAELILEEGSVRFYSLKAGKDAVLEPKEKLILDQETGQFVIESGRNVETETAWKRGELVFENVAFEDLINSVEKNYGVRIETDYRSDAVDSFTGTIPSNNLLEALTVIGKVYHLSVLVEGDKIRMEVE